MVNYVIAIPSYKRSETLKSKTLAMLKSNKINSKKIHVFVANNEEKKIYEETLDKNSYGKIIVGIVGMKNIRNFISNYFPENTYILNLDDDLSSIDYLETPKKLSKLKGLDKFIKDAFSYAESQGANLWGIYAVANPFFMNYGISSGLYYIVGAMWGNKNVHKKNIKVTIDDKEDFERSILYYNADGLVIRYNYVTIRTKYYKEQGGMQVTRTSDRVTKSAHYLIDKYPSLCELNTNKKSTKTELKFKKQKNNKRLKIDSKAPLYNKVKKVSKTEKNL
tara:strand:+ start:5470 stop:6303 length:834 start_codon:yes stop_codon:yes gene_type:complete